MYFIPQKDKQVELLTKPNEMKLKGANKLSFGVNCERNLPNC